VQQDDQVLRASVQHPVQFAPEVAPELSQFPAYLRAVREREVRAGGRQHVQAVDLIVQRHLALGIQSDDEAVDWLRPVRRTVVDGLKVRHRAMVSAPTDGSWLTRVPVVSIAAACSTDRSFRRQRHEKAISVSPRERTRNDSR
jgi:hypothetical protein